MFYTRLMESAKYSDKITWGYWPSKKSQPQSDAKLTVKNWDKSFHPSSVLSWSASQ